MHSQKKGAQGPVEPKDAEVTHHHYDSTAAPPAVTPPAPPVGLVNCVIAERDEVDGDVEIVRYGLAVRGRTSDHRPMVLWVELRDGVGTRSAIRLLRRAVAALERRIAPPRRRPRRGKGGAR